jgi:deoxyribonuclease IV
MKIKIGPSGVSGLSYEEAFEYMKDNGLKAFEVPFTYGVRIDKQRSVEIGRLAYKNKISLSVHAPYYINLASLDKDKIAASKQRILLSCERAETMIIDNASDQSVNIVFHIGFYQGRKSEEVYGLVKEEIMDLMQTIKYRGYRVTLCPETTGKPSQFGSLDEIHRLMLDTGCGICVDFAHLWAREQGKKSFDSIAMEVAKLDLNNIHAHFSGIDYGPKGEKKHIPFTEKYINEYADSLKRMPLKQLTIVCEAPNPMQDALYLKSRLENLSFVTLD